LDKVQLGFRVEKTPEPIRALKPVMWVEAGKEDAVLIPVEKTPEPIRALKPVYRYVADVFKH
jgi:hypothetical protein